MKVSIELRGTTPLLQHNARMADPDDEFVRAIAEITGKRKKTEDDRKAISRLEWYGGLYINGAGPVMPTGNIRKCIIESAKVDKLGKQVGRAFAFSDLNAPLSYEGPRDVDELFKQEQFQHRASVGIGARRTMRTRPVFPTWAVVAEGNLVTDVLDFDDFQRIVERAGIIEGLGDNRVNGYGRFDGKVVAAK